MDSFEANVARSQMFTSDVIKVQNVHAELKQRDLSQILTQRCFLYGQWLKRQHHARIYFITINWRRPLFHDDLFLDVLTETLKLSILL